MLLRLKVGGKWINGQGEKERVREGRRKEREFQIASMFKSPYDKSTIKSHWDRLICSEAMSIMVNS